MKYHTPPKHPAHGVESLSLAPHTDRNPAACGIFRSPTKLAKVPLGILFASLAAGGVGYAQSTLTWDGAAGATGANTVAGSNWTSLSNNNQRSNWTPELPLPVSGDTLIFAGTTKLANNNDTTTGNTYNITFNNTAGAFTLSGNRVTVGTGGIINSDAELQTINLPLTLTATSGAINTASGNIQIGGVIDGTNGVLTKTGGSTLTLTNANTYTGNTTISTGTLTLGASGSINNSPQISIASGATFNVSAVTGGYTLGASQTLSGSGTVTGNVTASGVISPGTSGIGTLSASNNVTWNSGSAWKFDLSSSDNTSDVLAITGTLNKGSGSSFAFDFMGSTPKWGETYTLLTFASSDFSLLDFNLAASIATLGAGPYNASSFTVNPTSLTFTAIPEPSSAVLSGLLLSAGLLRRRRGA